MNVNMHPLKPTLMQADFDAWPNCAVADCENKVTHYSDKCYPHTYGWDAVRTNLIRRIAAAERRPKRDPERIKEVAFCQQELERIKNFKPDRIEHSIPCELAR